MIMIFFFKILFITSSKYIRVKGDGNDKNYDDGGDGGNEGDNGNTDDGDNDGHEDYCLIII